MALVALSAETITVSTTAIGPTASKVTTKVISASFSHRSGGKLFHLTSSAPVAGGGNGEFGQNITDMWEIWGNDNIRNFKMIKQTGEADATIDIQYWGEGTT